MAEELGLKPHLVETFKLSSDPRFEEKLVDVVGLYLNPPDLHGEDPAADGVLVEPEQAPGRERAECVLEVALLRGAELIVEYDGAPFAGWQIQADRVRRRPGPHEIRRPR